MSKELENWKLERTVISQAYELTDLRDSNMEWVSKYQEAEKKYQAEKDRADRYGGLIQTIANIANDTEMSYEEQVTTIDTLIQTMEGEGEQ
ncbi:MAG: hypothetical protein KIH03_01665 [Paludibacteraceae bacterium]|nr:hypothetical protein [Paludibacteraceae bacterium]